MRPRARVPKKVRRVLRENAALKYIATVTKKLVSAQPLSVPSLPVFLYQVGKSVYNDTMVIPCGLYPGNNAGIVGITYSLPISPVICTTILFHNNQSEDRPVTSPTPP